jgi:hypothetical protein
MTFVTLVYPMFICLVNGCTGRSRGGKSLPKSPGRWGRSVPSASLESDSVIEKHIEVSSIGIYYLFGSFKPPISFTLLSNSLLNNPSASLEPAL